METATDRRLDKVVARTLRSAGFRLALLHTLVFVVSVAAIGFTAEALVTHALKEQARQRVEGEAAERVADFEEHGTEIFRKHVDADVAKGAGRLHFAVIGQDGRRLAGEQLLARAAASVPSGAHPAASEITISGPDTMLVAKRSLPDGTSILVADDLTSVEEVEDVVSGAFSIVLAFSTALGLAWGLLLSGLFLRRVDAVTRTADAIIAGDLTRRIARTGSGDDFDRLAATLNTMLDRIAHLMENLHQVSNDIAHDLRTPLSRLRQNLEDLRVHPEVGADHASAVDRAIAEADTLLATFAALLRIAQIEAGARRSAFGPVDLTEIVETVCEAYGPEAEEGGRSIVPGIERAVVVEGDRDLLMQLFANLIENALGHTPEGTAIMVSLKAASAGPIAEIADDGPGIPTESREQVFQRFFRLERSRTAPGNGLGLSTVAAIVDLHRAHVSLTDNRPGLRVAIRFKVATQPLDPRGVSAVVYPRGGSALPAVSVPD
jgi:signal transduction histidine kinase